MNQQASNDMNKTSVAFVEFLELLLLYHFRRNMFKAEIEFFIFFTHRNWIEFFPIEIRVYDVRASWSYGYSQHQTKKMGGEKEREWGKNNS